MTQTLHRFALLLPATLFAGATAAHAQTAPDKVNQVTVYDEKDCPPDTPDTITSCIVITGESPYRIPNALRTAPQTPPNTSPAVKAKETVTPVSGFGSCSAQGVASYATCSAQEYEAWKKQQGTGTGSIYAELIEKERRKRLGLIDNEAVEQQAIVDANGDGVVTVPTAPPTGVAPDAGTNATLPDPNEAGSQEVTQPVPNG